MSENLKLPAYGGQALIEGVLMRGQFALAAAMRAPDGTIITRIEPLGGIYQSRIKNIPFLRGLILLWDALGLGMRYLTISANIQTGEDEKLEGPTLYITLGIALLLAVGLFFIGPAIVGQWVEQSFGLNIWWSNLVEGIVRLIIVVLYIWGVGKIPEIRRVFAYHGAEHKTINAFEAGEELEPGCVSKYTLVHPRCGTSFLLTLVFLSIIVYASLGPLSVTWRLVSRIILIPILAGVAYEYIKWTANHLGNPLVRILVKPNLALQKLTTQEPDNQMLEVSIAAFKTMLAEEKRLSVLPVTHQAPGQQAAAGVVEYQSQQK